MLVDEAQSMTYDALEELRLLSNIETDQDKLLQMVLFGQPELDIALNAEKIRQLKSRISYSMFVPALQDLDVQAYLNYRMRKAGYSGLDVFDLKVSKKIQSITQGLPRNINVVADKVLMSIFSNGDKYAKNKHLKSLPDLETGVAASSGRQHYYLALIALLFIILFLSFLMFSNVLQTSLSQTAAFSNTIEDASSTTTGTVSMDGDHNHTDSLQSTTNKLDNSKELVLDADSQVIEEKFKSTVNDSTINIKGDDQNTNSIVMKHFDNVSVAKQINYQIKNPSAIISNPQQLQRIMGYHSKGKAWFESLSEKYVIQLSTDNIRTIDTTIRFHQRNKLNLDSIHIVVDYSKKNNKYRLKVFYVASSVFSDLSQKIDSLPAKYKSASPYIVRVDQVVQNLRYTDKKLQEVGILNE